VQQAILALIDRLGGGVSFVELGQSIAGFAGERDCLLNAHLIVWQGVSEAAITALNALQHSRQIVFLPCTALVYVIDGKTLRLPIAKRRDHPYQRPAWYPVTLSTPAQLVAHTSPLQQARRTGRGLADAPRPS
jgi:hypothetical protein